MDQDIEKMRSLRDKSLDLARTSPNAEAAAGFAQAAASLAIAVELRAIALDGIPFQR